VAVDQAGADPAAFAVDAKRRVECRGAGGGAGIQDAAFVRGDDAVADDAQPAAGVVERHQVGVVPDRIAVHARLSRLFVYTIISDYRECPAMANEVSNPQRFHAAQALLPQGWARDVR